MSKLRSISTSFWSDPFVEELSPGHKLLFIYLITNEKTNMLGIYEASIKKMSFETGLNKTDIEKGLKEFERLGKVKYEQNYVILRNFMKHQKYNPNMMKSAIDIHNNLPKQLKINETDVSKEDVEKGFESLLKGYGMVSKVETEVEDEIKIEFEFKPEVKETYEKCLQHFPDTLHPKSEKIKNNWLKTIDQLNRIDEIPFDFIIEITKRARNDDFWSENFLAITKLRKKNKEDIFYIIVFYEKFMRNENKKGNRGVTESELREVFTKHFGT